MELQSLTRCRWKFWGILLMALFIALYFFIFSSFSARIRYALIGTGFMIAIFFLRPSPRSWLPVLPLLFAAGGSTIAVGEFNPAAATLMMLAFSAYYLIDRTIWNKPVFIPSGPLFILLIAFLVQVVSIFISIHVHEQYVWNAFRDGSSIFLFAPLVLMVPAMCDSPDGLRRLHRAVVVTVLAVSVIGVMQYHSITSFSRIDMSIGYVYKGRIASLFGNPNIFAGYLELGIPLCIALFFLEKETRWKIVSLSATGFGLLSVLYTFSRGGLIMVFAGCGLTLVYVYRKRIWVPISLGAAAVLALLMSADTFERQMSFIMDPAGQMNQPTLLHRIISYRGFLNQFSESPITGVGYGAEEFYWSRSGLYSFWEVRFTRSFDNISRFGGLNSLFLNNMVKGGLVSLLSVILIFLAVFKAFFSILRRGGGLLPFSIAAGTLAFMGHQILGNQIRFPTVNSLFWFNTGLLLAFMAIQKRGKPEVIDAQDPQ